MRPTYKRPYYFIHNVNTYPEDTRWDEGTQPNTTVNLETKVDYKGRFGRVPSQNIYIPTDGGNTDISHLTPLEDSAGDPIVSRYGSQYVDDNNHYLPADRKYGISRYLDFSDIEATSNNWVRTGRGKIVGTHNGKELTLGDVSFTVVEDADHTIADYGNDISPGTIKVTWNTSVVKDITIANVTRYFKQSYSSITASS